MNKNLNTMNQRLIVIEERLGIVENGCSKMEEHITFVENVYNVVRAPLTFVKNQVEYISGNNTKKELPSIKK